MNKCEMNERNIVYVSFGGAVYIFTSRRTHTRRSTIDYVWCDDAVAVDGTTTNGRNSTEIVV